VRRAVRSHRGDIWAAFSRRERFEVVEGQPSVQIART